MAVADALIGLLRWTRRPQHFACRGHDFLTDMINGQNAWAGYLFGAWTLAQVYLLQGHQPGHGCNLHRHAGGLQPAVSSQRTELGRADAPGGVRVCGAAATNGRHAGGGRGQGEEQAQVFGRPAGPGAGRAVFRV